MAHLRDFVLSEGERYQELGLAADAISARKEANPLDDGLDGWTFMMRTPDRDLALLYFEERADSVTLSGFPANSRYRWTWFNPRKGGWLDPVEIVTDVAGTLHWPAFPIGEADVINDWAAKLVRLPR
jgi:hypothetical protein